VKNTDLVEERTKEGRELGQQDIQLTFTPPPLIDQAAKVFLIRSRMLYPGYLGRGRERRLSSALFLFAPATSAVPA